MEDIKGSSELPSSFKNLEESLKARLELEQKQKQDQSPIIPLTIEGMDDVVKPLLQVPIVQEDYAPIISIPKERRAILPKLEIKTHGIPSLGILYPKEARIFYTTYLEVELRNIASTINNVTIDILFRQLFEGIYVVGMDKNDLTFDDFLFILFLRRIGTFGDDTLVYNEKCPLCGTSKTIEMSYKAVSTYDLDPKKPLPHKESFKFYYGEDTNFTEEVLDLEFTPLRMGRFFELADLGLLSIQEANYAFMCTNKDPMSLYENEFQVLTPGDFKKFHKMDTIFRHSFMEHTVDCGRVLESENTSDVDNSGGVSDLENNVTSSHKETCKGKIAFDVNPGYSLVVPLPIIFSVD